MISEDFLKGLSDAMKVLKPHIDEARSYDGDLSVLTQFDRMCCYLSGLEDAEKVIADWYYRRVQVCPTHSLEHPPAPRGRTVRCAKSRLFSTPGSHGSQGHGSHEFCTLPPPALHLTPHNPPCWYTRDFVLV